MQRKDFFFIMFLVTVTAAAFFMAGMDFNGFVDCRERDGVYHYSTCYKKEVLN